MSDLKVVDSIIILWIILCAYHPVAYTETVALVDEELNVAFVRLVQAVVLMKHVVEEGLAQLTRLHFVETCRIKDVGVVHIDDSRLLRELLIDRVEHVDETCLLEVAEVVDHSGAAGLDALCQKTHVRRTWSLLCKDMKQFLEFWKIAEFYLLEEENIDLKHGIHILNEHLAVVLLLKEERIETMVDVVLEIRERLNDAAYLCGYLLMVGNNLLIAVWTEVGTSYEIDVFAEREATEVV